MLQYLVYIVTTRLRYLNDRHAHFCSSDSGRLGNTTKINQPDKLITPTIQPKKHGDYRKHKLFPPWVTEVIFKTKQTNKQYSHWNSIKHSNKPNYMCINNASLLSLTFCPKSARNILFNNAYTCRQEPLWVCY
jgi:hypothetical protein